MKRIINRKDKQIKEVEAICSQYRIGLKHYEKEISRLKEQLVRAEEVLKKIANTDYRVNKSTEIQLAQDYFKGE